LKRICAHPEDAARVEAYRQQNDALHRAFDPVLRGPHRLVIGAPTERRWRWTAALDATFVGGEVLGMLPPAGEVGDAPVALFMYENAHGKRLSLLVRREASAKETAFRFSQRRATSVFYWIGGPLGMRWRG
jgi:anti-sigma factor RsiW